MARYEFPLDYGLVVFEGNEIHVTSTIDDPPQLFLASPRGISLGGVTFGRTRPDGKIDGMVLIQGKQDERVRHDPNNLTAECTVHLRHWQPGMGDDQQFVPIIEVRYDGVRIRGINW
mgnify:FL=1